MTIEKSAVLIVKGLSSCLSGPRPLRSEMVNTPDFWSTIRRLASVAEAADGIFDLLVDIMEDSSSVITADNYESTILLSNDFATAASAGAIIEQKQDHHNRKAKPLKSSTTRLVYGSACMLFTYTTIEITSLSSVA